MKLQYIDALRGIAILGVIMINTGNFGSNEYPSFFQSLINTGERGVQLFFVVSAFTLFLSCQRRLTKRKLNFQSFFIRRFFRIAPLYYLGIIYYLWQNGVSYHFWLGSQDGITTTNIVSNFFFIHGISPNWINSIVPGGWSITVEMMFYLMIPFLFSRIKNLNNAINFTLITLFLSQSIKLIGYSYSPILEVDLWKAYLNLFLPSQLPVFGCGIIAFFIIIKKDFTISKTNLILVSFLAICDFIWPKIIPPNLNFGIGFVLITFALSKYPIKFLVNKTTKLLGRISYSAYLIHFAILYWLNHLNLVDFITSSNSALAILNYFIRFTVVIFLTIGLSYISFYLIEKPMQKIGNRFIQNKIFHIGKEIQYKRSKNKEPVPNETQNVNSH